LDKHASLQGENLFGVGKKKKTILAKCI